MTMIHGARIVTLLAASVLAATSAFAQESKATDSAESTEPTAAAATRRALIVCGLSGDAAHHKQFAETVTKLHTGLTTQLGFTAENVQLLFGDEPQDDDEELIKSSVRSTREELEKAVAATREKLRPEDALWVIVLGHSHYDARHSWLNLPGPDIQQTDFAKLFTGLVAAEQVFILTMPTSGFYIKPLSAKGRVVITATEADWETNETEFPQQLTTTLGALPPEKEFDIDQDGAITVFDLYITVTRNLAQSYVERELLATEHPLLDDNGDSRGTEVQIDYLTVDQGGRVKPNKATLRPSSPTADGALAKTIKLPLAR